MIEKNVEYKKIANQSLMMDVYRPGNVSNERKAAIVFLHGEGLEIMLKKYKGLEHLYILREISTR